MAEPSHIVYAIPLREGVVARIHGLPDDLTKREAERIAAVVVALGAHPMTWPAVDGSDEYDSWTHGVPASLPTPQELAKKHGVWLSQERCWGFDDNQLAAFTTAARGVGGTDGR